LAAKAPRLLWQQPKAASRPHARQRLPRRRATQTQEHSRSYSGRLATRYTVMPNDCAEGRARRGMNLALYCSRVRSSEVLGARATVSQNIFHVLGVAQELDAIVTAHLGKE